MVDKANVVTAVWDGSEGGTANTYGYAKSQGRPIYRINPVAKTEGWETIFNKDAASDSVEA